MARKAYAKRYAQAAFEIAVERGQLDAWQSDLRKIARLLEDDALAMFLKSPKIGFGDKARLLSERLSEINPLVLNLLYLLIAKDRFSMAGEIAEEYQRLLSAHRGIEEAEVTTAIPLDDEDRQNLEKRLEAIFNKKVSVRAEVDASLIGGVVARIGGKLLDGSIRSRLQALKKQMSGVSR